MSRSRHKEPTRHELLRRFRRFTNIEHRVHPKLTPSQPNFISHSTFKRGASGGHLLITFNLPHLRALIKVSIHNYHTPTSQYIATFHIPAFTSPIIIIIIIFSFFIRPPCENSPLYFRSSIYVGIATGNDAFFGTPAGYCI